MKKIFSLMMAAALVAFSMTSCDKKGGNEPDDPVTPGEDSTVVVKIAINEDVRFDDYVSSDGWWQLMAQNEEYYVTLSNAGSVTKVAGKYEVKDLDPDYSYIGILATEETVALKDGSISLTVENDGKKVVALGKFTGEDDVVYELNIVYNAPEAKNVVEANFTEAELDDTYGAYGLWTFYAQSNELAVLLSLWAEENLVGSFSEADLDEQYVGSAVQDVNGVYQIYQANITITPSNEDQLLLNAQLLCYNNTLYKVTMVVPAPAQSEGDEGGEKAPARKAIVKKVAKKAFSFSK